MLTLPTVHKKEEYINWKERKYFLRYDNFTIRKGFHKFIIFTLTKRKPFEYYLIKIL